VASATRERPRYVFGGSSDHRVLCRVIGITPSGAGRVALTCVAEDDRVHGADAAWVPTVPPGALRPAVLMAEGAPTYDEATDEQRAIGGWLGNANGSVGLRGDGGYTLS